MKTNTLLTYILYALLVGLVLAAGYQACRMQQKKKQAADEEAAMEKTFRDLGLVDTTGGGGSTFVEGSDTFGVAPQPTTKQPEPAAPANGIEDDAPSTSAAPTTTQQQPKTAAPKTTTPKTSSPTVSTKGSAPSRDLDSDQRGGRYQVRVGTFASKDNARDQLEKVIKLGYQQAEIGKTNGGKYATVVVMRTNNLNAAIKVADKLEDKGLDALVYDTVRKRGAKN